MCRRQPNTGSGPLFVIGADPGAAYCPLCRFVRRAIVLIWWLLLAASGRLSWWNGSSGWGGWPAALGSAARAVGAASCPGCGRRAGRVHSRYERRLADAAVAGAPVEIRLRVRRLFCDIAGCAGAHVRRASRRADRPARPAQPAAAADCCEAIGLALAGRAGARLAERLGLATSRSTRAALGPRVARSGDWRGHGARRGRLRPAPRPPSTAPC